MSNKMTGTSESQFEPTKPKELYNRLMRNMANFSREDKNLQYLTTELFQAAAEDVQRDVATKKGTERDAIDFKSGSKIALDKVIDNYIEKLEIKAEPDKGEFKKFLEDKLTPEYKELKVKLNDVRVFGVGKNGWEKAAALLNMAGRTAATVLAVAGSVASVALSIMASKERGKAWDDVGKGDISDAASGFYVANQEDRAAKSGLQASKSLWDTGVGPTEKLDEIKNEMKRVLKGAPSALEAQLNPMRAQSDTVKDMSGLTEKPLKDKRMYKGRS